MKGLRYLSRGHDGVGPFDDERVLARPVQSGQSGTFSLCLRSLKRMPARLTGARTRRPSGMLPRKRRQREAKRASFLKVVLSRRQVVPVVKEGAERKEVVVGRRKSSQVFGSERRSGRLELFGRGTTRLFDDKAVGCSERRGQPSSGGNEPASEAGHRSTSKARAEQP